MSQQPDSRHDAVLDEPVDAILAEGVDEEAIESNRRLFEGWQWWLIAILAVAYSVFHLVSLNVYPMETWSFRIVHVCGALILGYASYAGCKFAGERHHASPAWLGWLSYALLLPAGFALTQVVMMQRTMAEGAMRIEPVIENWYFGAPLLIATGASSKTGTSALRCLSQLARR
ncbi:MAG: TRAP transporter permease, partial [Halomonas sp.]